MDKQFEELYPEINEHLKTPEGLRKIVQAMLWDQFNADPNSLAWLEAALPKPYYPPVSPNSNPSSINA